MKDNYVDRDQCVTNTPNHDKYTIQTTNDAKERLYDSQQEMELTISYHRGAQMELKMLQCTRIMQIIFQKINSQLHR